MGDGNVSMFKKAEIISQNKSNKKKDNILIK